ncbi:PIN domain-containing protein [Petrimonas sulfuriphila]|uniref:PIN domain-containing protein n=1 Tax=Petrimonas sulfuriphila TaxID=285070 RepID=UPI003EBEC91B
MHYIALDTNTWVYLANGMEPVRLLHYLKNEVENGNIRIILPDIVSNEWEVHKEKSVRQGSLKHFNDIKEALDRLRKLLGEKGEKGFLSFLLNEDDKKEYFEDFFKSFKQKKKEIEDAVNENIKLVDDLFKNHAVKIDIKDNIYKKAGLFALGKKAPFKMKNSFADALILFSYLDFLVTEDIEDAIFVTYNTDDFCEKKEGKKILHPDLIDEFNHAKCKFYKIVGEAINTIEKDIVSMEELELIEEMQNERARNDNPEFCELCQDNNNEYHEIIFDNPVELIDERIKNRYDPNQLELAFGDNFVKKIISEPPTTIEVGYCDWCNTEHFICIDCGKLNALWQGDYNENIECQGCGLTYFVKITTDRKGMIEDKVYIIPKKTLICEKCGGEFEEDQMIENICIECENEYSYGEK